jgi:hypothetical protein
MPTPSTEIEFELSAAQYELMGYPGLQQGQPLSTILETGVLLPAPGAEQWYIVQPERLAPRWVQVGRATYAFTGQIEAADFLNEDGLESAVLVIDCGEVRLRVPCAPGENGRLPYGTWETRTLTGVSRIHGIVEDDFHAPIGAPVGLTIWGFRRLTLGPGDPLFGEWHEADALLPLPFGHDRVVITAHLHRWR